LDKKVIRGISLFSGAGGLDIGFEQAGFKILLATDIDTVCCETLNANTGNTLSPDMVVVNSDIWEIDLETLPNNIDFIIGGPPCQTFSASGRRAGGAPGRLDKRGSLFKAYCDVIKKTSPTVFLFENVRGILGTNKGKDFEEIISSFTSLGYRIDYRILDAEDYGVPQQRERIFIVGHKMDSEFLFPRPLYGSDSLALAPHISVKQAIEDLPFTDNDRIETYFGGGKYTELLPLVPPGSNYLHFTAKRGYPSPIFAYRSRFSDFLYKANPDAPVKTLIASPGKYTGPLHWDNRYLTVHEYMRIQGFPDNHFFVGNRSDKLRQIGNSVSPKIAFMMALAIKQQIFGIDCSVDLIDKSFKLSFDKRKGQKAQITKAKHEEVAASYSKTTGSLFILNDYEAFVEPFWNFSISPNVFAKVLNADTMQIRVYSDLTEQLFAKMKLVVQNCFSKSREINLCVELYGEQAFGIQTMWNAVDDWVKRSSSFRSLMELYGHFTEPHPIFNIVEAEAFSTLPICKFAVHFMSFDNCSVYFKKEQLMSMWKDDFLLDDFGALARELRGYRYDLRSYETNLAIPNDVYMVAYPFTLPYDKQMNFAVKENRDGA